jgi:Rps23 Pro-64 3,4-dihydroxylase Tpa1-like proline 4-hydroxylase
VEKRINQFIFKLMNTVLDKFDPDKHYFKTPYPHVVIENALPQTLYETLAKDFPVQAMKEKLPLIEGHTYRYLANDVLNKKTIPVSEEWQTFFETHTSQTYYEKVLDIFKNDMPYSESKIKTKIQIRGLDETKRDMVTDTQFVVHNPINAGTTRTTHIDNPQELYAGLLYFRQPIDNSTGGDFEIFDTKEVKGVHKLKGREISQNTEKTLVRTVKYKPNTFVMFLNTGKSVHGVTPRQNATVERLSINIIAETRSKQNLLFHLKNA